MRVTGLLTTALIMGLSGVASAGCVGAGHSTTASAETTPLPTADASKATAAPAILLPQDGAKTEEG